MLDHATSSLLICTLTQDAPKEQKPLWHDAVSRLLKDRFGHEALTKDQEAVLEHVFARQDCLAILPTGSGKSLCFQLPSLMFDGYVLVISPLIALMSDQVEAMQKINVRAFGLNSNLDPSARKDIFRAMREGQADVIYAAPETLAGLTSVIQKTPPSLIVIDEAHCVSLWGHDFRPDYRQIGALTAHLADIPVLCLTATADEVTRKDILAAINRPHAAIILGQFARKNLSLRFEQREKKPVEQLTKLLDKRRGQGGIIYVRTRDGCEKLSRTLNALGHAADFYHAGLSAQIRERKLAAFMAGGSPLMVATVAFGMGINKPDVRFVIHMEPPSSLEAYWQEVGRAGRDQKPAFGLCYIGEADLGRDMLRLKRSEEVASETKEFQAQKLRAFYQFFHAKDCRQVALARYFGGGEERPCGHCDRCLSKKPSEDLSRVAQMVLSALYRLNGPSGRVRLMAHLMGASSEPIYSQKLSTYGIGKEVGEARLKAALWRLEALGAVEALELTPHQPLITLNHTKISRDILKGDQAVLA